MRNPVENNLYWGDLHLHTNQSPDAFLNGTRAVSPEEAFRFVRGGAVKADNGMTVRLKRPYDFVAITDHSEYMGVFPRLLAHDKVLDGWGLAGNWGALLEAGNRKGLGVAFSNAIQSSDPALRTPAPLVRTVWDEVADRADRYNDPGRFTALIAYEWTSMINGDNLHRNVIFRGNAADARKVLPFTAQDSTDPEDLWNALSRYDAKGVKVLAIAHNGNVSNGRMFAPNRINGQPLNARYAEMRSRWEPVYEVTQVKGDGEAHPALSPEDEFADFETWDQGNISLTAAKQPWMLQYEYARSALKNGLAFERKLGTNPFKFGMIGSTDSHTGLSTADEANFFGKFLESEPSPDRWKQKMAGLLEESWELGASGLAAVWAPENTRAAIFDALTRREVYGTTGSRIALRFFGGWDFAKVDIDRPDYARYGYKHGVPMGGDLGRADTASPPSFLVHAVRDPDGANLDRAQVVKGWLDSDGKTHEKIYNVALSDGRKNDANGKAPSVGSTVDLKNASFTNSIGAPELATWWQDPDFDASQPAFYYVRVIEIPRPRWTAYDEKFFGIKMPDEVRRIVQDRAYSSPIWYHP
ncbi:hypothetical protein LK12_01360 [Novosphingobium malaysiense]|uniref:DUF3604 domain-containing protein n=2 Tax=Novosphingobium malaysiense TaxID=1348853 RepID=A0A0B1ZV97_9SPHN|nr:hypothetical protein LK12_01360 [Novosphingobium malaysiense]